MVRLRMVSEASFSFGITNRESSSVRMNVYVSPISSTTPSTSSTDDAVAEPQRLRERDQDPGDRVAERALRGEADDEAEHRRGREDAAGDRAHLRDHEQRREDADEDDRRRHGRGARRGSASLPRARARAGSAPCRRASRARASPRRRSPRSEGGARCAWAGPIRDRVACVLRTLLPARASTQPRPRRVASRAGSPRRRAARGSRRAPCRGP